MLEVVPDDLLAGSVVGGRYRLERVVGEGGMGVVWAATHTLTGKKCALKFVKPGRAGDPRTYRRLLIEAQSACAVNHPNVAQAHDVLELPSGVPFIVMDFLEGESLRARLTRQKRLSTHETARILLPVTEAVSAAHARGIVHRDLKPENVFLERAPGDDDRVKLLDFGIAKRAHDLLEAGSGQPTPESHGLTTFSALGTPSYMAPEQRARGTSVDGRADVWALGVILFECLTGARPTLEDVPAPQKLAERLRQAAQELTPTEAQTLTRLLAAEPTERATLEELQVVLRAHRNADTELATVVARRHEARSRSPLQAVAWAAAGAAVLFGAWAMRGQASQAQSAPQAQPVPEALPVLATQATAVPMALPNVASVAPNAVPSAAPVRRRKSPAAPPPALAPSAVTAPEPTQGHVNDIPSHERH
jgi:serine/threonine-protein kinase